MKELRLPDRAVTLNEFLEGLNNLVASCGRCEDINAYTMTMTPDVAIMISRFKTPLGSCSFPNMHKTGGSLFGWPVTVSLDVPPHTIMFSKV